MRVLPLLFALTASTFCIPQSACIDDSPCLTDSEQMYPHRRSLSPRQFVGIQVIPGQGTDAPPPRAKYIITHAIIEQYAVILNGSKQEVPERFTIHVANASAGSTPVTCSIYWDAALVVAENETVGYPMDCENSAFCGILEQQAQKPGVGFYLYVSLPNSMGTMAAWMVKDLYTASGWASFGTSLQGEENWEYNGTAALTRMPSQPLSTFVGS